MEEGQCKDGLIVPALSPSTWHALIYLAGLLYCFLGTAIIADIFMCAIETITSTTRKVKKKTEDDALVDEIQPDKDEYEYVKVWNPTVANLTLMALGSSAPEILLSLIEIVANGFKSGDLGPGTIVGSAAFNLFCISAICVLSVSSPRSKRIDAFYVFCVTTVFAVLAYVWLIAILVWISPDVVETWEAALTLFFFFILVTVAWAVDVQLWRRRGKAHLERVGQEKIRHIERDNQELSPIGKRRSTDLDSNIEKYASRTDLSPRSDDYEDIRNMTREISRVYPALSAEDHAKVLAYRINQTAPRDRLYYRIKAIRQFTSSWSEKKVEEEVQSILRDGEDGGQAAVKPRVEFSARTYGIHPGDNTVRLSIVRRGPMAGPLTVSYCTVNGTAKKDSHFMEKKASIRFDVGDKEKQIGIHLVEAAEWTPQSVFYVHLRIEDQDEDDRTKLGETNVARIRVPDGSGNVTTYKSVEFAKPNYVIAENAGWARVFVHIIGQRANTGSFTVNYETHDVSAKEFEDYVPIKDGKLEFVGNEIEKYIDIHIIDDKKDEKDEIFLVKLLDCNDKDITIGNRKSCTVTIISDDNVLRNITNVRKLMGNHLKKLKFQQASWKDQIISASSVNGGDVWNASVCDAIMHGIAFPWKFIFAFVPPPAFLGGWPCFVIALACIGVITAAIGDLASIFGCMLGIKDAITAITLVALGTSLPDTFASKIAAQNDPNADNAVGNVTGSNSVNVFLGLGLPWLVAAIYWQVKGEVFRVPAGDLGYSVIIFTIFSLVCIGVIVLRRNLAIFGKGELGGPFVTKVLSALLFVGLWIGYIVLSILKIQSQSQEHSA